MSKNTISGIKVYQWMDIWNEVVFDVKSHRRKPEPFFYIFSISANQLRKLSGIYRRTTESNDNRSNDLGIQRRHEEKRSDEIRDFIKYGYPWSDLSKSKRDSNKFNDLRKPGWLPTAIVINILKDEDVRRNKKVYKKDIIQIEETTNKSSNIILPEESFKDGWKPSTIPPIEIIDGQHRLWAFQDLETPSDFELPVVAFHGLDISWQAYLFWSINIKPKRINASLAFDLYPLLRTEEWLDKFDGHKVYREARSQELVETLWSYPESPWYKKINMLGEPGIQGVSQAAWIRSLMVTYIRAWESSNTKIGGLFGSNLNANDEILPWNRSQQAAFLILMGIKLQNALKICKAKWAEDLRKRESITLFENSSDPTFWGPHTLLNTDQGIRGLLHITNDLTYLSSQNLDLMSWISEKEYEPNNESVIRELISELNKKPVAKFLEDLMLEISQYDWRTSTAPSLSEELRREKLVFRGSGGYKELRSQLLKHLAKSKSHFSRLASEVEQILGI